VRETGRKWRTIVKDIAFASRSFLDRTLKNTLLFPQSGHFFLDLGEERRSVLP
jgi:hypothetical protein